MERLKNGDTLKLWVVKAKGDKSENAVENGTYSFFISEINVCIIFRFKKGPERNSVKDNEKLR